MEIYECILSLIGGIGAFMIAMELLTKSLNELAGEKMKSILQKITGNLVSLLSFNTIFILCIVVDEIAGQHSINCAEIADVKTFVIII